MGYSLASTDAYLAARRSGSLRMADEADRLHYSRAMGRNYAVPPAMDYTARSLRTPSVLNEPFSPGAMESFEQERVGKLLSQEYRLLERRRNTWLI
ncbi:hypothetical protein D6789_00070 [Candidatus Woesearchaeota archaeon]|nr:MAG: hypothetical protein D6789_00070 [Candidatus Woesearchaeota archaeon]